MNTTIQRCGDDYGIPLPQRLIDQMGLRENDRLEIEARDNEIVLRVVSDTTKTL